MSSKTADEVFVAYFTEGRDKYEYNTIFEGVFIEREKALKSIFSTLVDEGKILDVDTLIDIYNDDGVEHLLTIFKDEESFHEYTSNTYESGFPFHLLNPDAELESIIKNFNDSFYKDGWDYTIKSTLIKY